jgi:hypothetical protein
VYAQKRNLKMVVTSEIHDDDDRSIISFLATEIVLPDMP